MRRTGLIARRVSLRRRPTADPVTPEVRAAVLERDRICFAYRIERSVHQCRDQYGHVHSPYATERLSLDHVLEAARMGRRAPSDPAHLIALCHWANTDGWASAHRAEERSYLQAVSESEHTHVEPVPGGQLEAALAAARADRDGLREAAEDSGRFGYNLAVTGPSPEHLGHRGEWDDCPQPLCVRTRSALMAEAEPR